MSVEPAGITWLSDGIDGEAGWIGRKPISFGKILHDLRKHGNARGIAFDVDGDDLSQSGWAVVFAEQTDPAIRQALQPLLDLRREQAGSLFREVVYHGEGSGTFRRGLGLAPGPIDPSRLPYYVLLVGDPERLPFELQFDLSIQRAVGRLEFTEIEAWQRYAQNVARNELEPQAPPSATIFGVANEDDAITHSCLEHLALPLAKALTASGFGKIGSLLGADATKKNLLTALGDQRPSLLFTASHAVRFPAGHPRQRAEQGALVCADWPGSRWQKPLPAEFLFSGIDFLDSAALPNTVAFLYACYTLGTPQTEIFDRTGTPATQLAPAPFVARLAQDLLSHPDGGCLAVVGHVDQTLESTWNWPGAEGRAGCFVDAARSLLKGRRLGFALESFSRRSAEISAEVALQLWRLPEAAMSESQRLELATLWQAMQDARSFGILGDPAVRLQDAQSAPGDR